MSGSIRKNKPAKAAKPSGLSHKAVWIITAVMAAIFTATGLYCLAGTDAVYLRKVEEQSIFMSGGWYFGQCMSHPDGLLTWLSTWFTQFFYHPWLGSIVITAMLLGFWWMVCKVFRLPLKMWGAGAVPSAMLLLGVITPGYLIFTMKTPGFAYSTLLGLGFAVGIFALYRALPALWWRIGVIVLSVIVGYPLIGFFALFGVLLCVIGQFFDKSGAGSLRWWALVAAAVTAWGVPQLYFYLTEEHVMLSNLYTVGLPRFVADYSNSLWGPYLVAMAWLALLAAMAPRQKAVNSDEPVRRNAVICGGVIFAAAIATVFTCRYSDEVFSRQLDMDQAITEGRYDDALKEAREMQSQPTRIMALYTHLALLRQGKAGDELFTYPTSDAEYKSPLPTVAMRAVSGRALNFGFGRVNDAYRWCMEYMVEHGPKVDYLKYMVRCALLNGEYKLARRYGRMLQRTMFHKEWADRYMAMADNPELIDQDPELAAVKSLMAYDNSLGGDSGLVEAYITTALTVMAGGPPAIVELSLQMNMIQKNIDEFWPRFILYARTHDRLPRHYQEAALLFSALEGKVDWHQFRIDPEVAQRFAGFMEMAQKNAGRPEDVNRELFAPVYGDTYWFYYFFTNNLKTT